MGNFDPEKNYYRILGVGEDATKEQIDRVFRARAREHHPDAGGSEQQMKSLNEAHDLLSDSDARQAYDEMRRSMSAPRRSSVVFDPDAASKTGDLRIPAGDDDFTGLCIGAAACIGLGLPFLVLVEMQWVFFLWPLRLLTIGALGLGVFLGHSALRVRNQRSHKKIANHSRARLVLEEIIFWTITAAGAGVVYLSLYAK